ncbi:methylaspartate mutase [Streptomyces sp. NPDC093250]|uniref:methylaspartate mutase n=1 Tax=Streptomyces sp. NPDC093250 TaxID=3366036 RepID=UPI00381037C5
MVQPRMGMGEAAAMRAGLLAVKRAAADTVGTLTIDSYTRVGRHDAARIALDQGQDLNGYPLPAHPAATTRALLDGVWDDSFPVQVRHGSAFPLPIVRSAIDLGLVATEGGPVSYCLPYSRRPLRESVRDWARCCHLLAQTRTAGADPHLETFGGCMLGQLCPPSLLVAISVLEAMFFHQHGLRSISLSYAQQTSPEQDAEAVAALRHLATELLPDTDWHIVIYTYMGLFPRTPEGATRLLAHSARLAVHTGAARLVVKTTAEAHRIPTVSENVTALEVASEAAARERAAGPPAVPQDTGVLEEARSLVEAVLVLHADIGTALESAFTRGYLDVPYCLHPDNAGRARGFVDRDGRVHWADLGALPLPRSARCLSADRLSASQLLASLSYMAARFDAPVLNRADHTARASDPLEFTK